MKTFKRYFSLLLVSVFLSACFSQPEPPMRLGTNVWPGYEPLYLARSMGMYPDDLVRLVEYPSASEVLRAFRNKTLEAASLTLDEVLLLRQDNIPVKVVLVHDISAGGDVIIARSGIDSMKQLRGKRVGVEGNALGALVLTRALEKHGMSIKDVEPVSADVNTHEALFAGGKVDAVETFDPVKTKLLKAGGREVFSSLEIPNEIVDVLVVHVDYLQKNEARVKKITQGWFDAIEQLKSNPEESAKIMSARLDVTPMEVLGSYDGLHIPGRDENRRLLDDGSGSLRKTIEHLHRVLRENDLIQSGVSTKSLITAKYL